MTSILNALLIMTTAADPFKPGNHTRSLEVDQRQRNYLVHVPPSYDGSRTFPVVLAFHGGGSDADMMVAFCGLNDKADRAGFLAVYPNGTGRLPRALTWNAGNCCAYAMQNKVDDVAFTRAVIADLEKALKVDGKRIYATGMSNGGMMAYRLAAELSERIAAVAPVGGPMGTETCKPKRPVPVMHFHGTADEFAPFAGGKGAKSLSGTNFYSVDHSINAWLKANGCPKEPVVTRFADAAKDGTTVVRRTYGPGKDGSEVVLVVIEGGGHTWPGRQPRLALLGKSTRNISANDMMWEFFQRHSLK
jgi:polyhydroxybutyrate depolymerase